MLNEVTIVLSNLNADGPAAAVGMVQIHGKLTVSGAT